MSRSMIASSEIHYWHDYRSRSCQNPLHAVRATRIQLLLRKVLLHVSVGHRCPPLLRRTDVLRTMPDSMRLQNCRLVARFFTLILQPFCSRSRKHRVRATTTLLPQNSSVLHERFIVVRNIVLLKRNNWTVIRFLGNPNAFRAE